MTLIAEKSTEHFAETSDVENHEPDLIQELGQRLGCLWGYDRFIEKTANRPELKAYWLYARSQEQMRIEQLKRLIEQRILSNS